MSVRALMWATAQTAGDDKAKSCLLWLAWHHNDETGLCCPSISTLMREMEVASPATVRGAINRLCDRGLLTFEREMDPKGFIHRTVYSLPLPQQMTGPRPSANDRPLPQQITGGGLTAVVPVPQQMTPKEKQERKEKGKEEREEGAAAPAARTRSSSFIPPEVASGEIPRDVFNDWMKIRRAKRAPLTATAWAGVVREAGKAGLPIARAVELMVEHSWQGLKAGWQDVQAEAARAQGKPEPRQGTLFAPQAPPQEQYRSPYAEPSPEVKARQKAQQERATRWANYQAALRRQKQGLELPKSMAGWLEPGYVEGIEGELKCNA